MCIQLLYTSYAYVCMEINAATQDVSTGILVMGNDSLSSHFC